MDNVKYNTHFRHFSLSFNTIVLIALAKHSIKVFHILLNSIRGAGALATSIRFVIFSLLPLPSFYPCTGYLECLFTKLTG
jgi:hypothetical protein